MKLRYAQEAIDAARAAAEANGHTFAGRFTRVRSGLSWENSCQRCHWPVTVVPAWTPWERDDVFGDAVWMSCPVGTDGR